MSTLSRLYQAVYRSFKLSRPFSDTFYSEQNKWFMMFNTLLKNMEMRLLGIKYRQSRIKVLKSHQKVWSHRGSPVFISWRRFADILQTLGQSVAFLGKRSDLPLDLSNQEWHNSDKEVGTRPVWPGRRPTSYPIRRAKIYRFLSQIMNLFFFHSWCIQGLIKSLLVSPFVRH